MHHALIFSLGSGFKGRYIQGRPSGAYRIATELRQQNWDVEVIDFFHFWTFDELKALSKSRITNKTKFIGFSHLWTEWPELAENLCKWIKSIYPDIIIFFGSMIYQNLNSKYIDYYFKGFSEIALFKLLNYLFSNGQEPTITKIDGNNLILSDQHYIAAPWKDPLIIYEDRDFLESFEWVSIEFSRGCKFACKFCNFPILGVKGDYTRDSSSFEKQIRNAYDRFGITRYSSNDETFNDSVEKISKFADVVERLNFQPFFAGFMRPDLVISRVHEREELLRMNFLGHFYGVESFNYESAKFIGKGMHPDKVKQGLVDLKNYFKTHGRKLYRGFCSFIGGLPYETEENVLETYKWLKENWISESFMLLPYELEKPKKSSLKINNISIISADYEKFGYREMSKEKIETHFTDFERRSHIREKTVYWENDHTNYFRISKIIREITQDSEQLPFTIPTYSLSADYTGDSIEKTLSKTVFEYDNLYESGRRHVELYKTKKLSL